MVVDIIKSAKARADKYRCNRPLTLYEKYTRKDVCKLLNWKNDESSTIYGYKTKYQTCPIFVTYHKKEDIDSSTKYSKEFISQDVFKWSTRSNRTLDSKEVQTIIHAGENGIDLHLFVKKDDDEGSDFYYLGRVTPDQNEIEEAVMKDKNGKEIPVVHMNLIMEQPIDYKLYPYLQTR